VIVQPVASVYFDRVALGSDPSIVYENAFEVILAIAEEEAVSTSEGQVLPADTVIVKSTEER